MADRPERKRKPPQVNSEQPDALFELHVELAEADLLFSTESDGGRPSSPREEDLKATLAACVSFLIDKGHPEPLSLDDACKFIQRRANRYDLRYKQGAEFEAKNIRNLRQNLLAGRRIKAIKSRMRNGSIRSKDILLSALDERGKRHHDSFLRLLQEIQKQTPNAHCKTIVTQVLRWHRQLSPSHVW